METTNTPENPVRGYTAQEFAAYCKETHPATVADALAELPAAEVVALLQGVDPERRAEVFSHFSGERQAEYVAGVTPDHLVSILRNLSSDERTDVFRELPEQAQVAAFPLLARVEREEIRRLASYEEGTAGSVMTSDYAVLGPSLSVQAAIAKLRLEAPDKETIYDSYVLDDQRKLVGVVSLKDLILARPESGISEIMRKEVIHSHVSDDQEDVARKLSKYDLIAVPVLDANEALVGIVTYDDVMDIIQQEHTEDVERLMAIGGSPDRGGYLAASAWSHFRRRAGWIVGLSIMGLISGSIIHSFENTLTAMMILALYMPMIADTGGNTGSQAATVMVRALALQEIRLKDAARVLFKELQIALLLSTVLGLIAYGKVLFLSWGTDVPVGYSLSQIALVIAGALAAQVITATLIGAALPLVASRLKLDPAVVATPALTTVVDITGLLIYFYLAWAMLGV